MEALDYNPVHPPNIYSWERTEGIMEYLKRARKCVVFIGKKDNHGKFIPLGTGFFIIIIYEGIQFEYLVTCYHIIDLFHENEKIWIRINLKIGDSELKAFHKNDWLYDVKQDIAILPCYFSIDTYDITHITQKDFATIDCEIYPDLFAGELTYLVGLFTSHYGGVRNIPIVRMGSLAAPLDEPIYTNTGYIKAYLVETRSIGGLSGSPVFLYYRLSDFPQQEHLLESYFLGMMRGRFNAKEASDVVVGDSEADAINTGIGIVVPVDEIVKTLHHPNLVKQREETYVKGIITKK
jgi:hypothetical protein